MAAAAASKTDGKQPGAGKLVITIIALTVLAAVGGGLLGRVVTAQSKTVSVPPATASKPGGYATGVELKELPAVVTNLAQPEDARVRIQVAMVYPTKAVENPNILAARINDDIIAYLKTLTLAELQGPSGLQALREDLSERASTRSDGKVREIIIEALVVQ